jgi:hypothetical protein
MAKNAVKPFIVSELFMPLQIKSLAVLFDKIFIHDKNITELKDGVEHAQTKKTIAIQNLREFEYLIDKGIIQPYSSEVELTLEDFKKYNVRKLVEEYVIENYKNAYLFNKEVSSMTDEELDYLSKYHSDFGARIKAVKASKDTGNDFIAVLYNSASFDNGEKKNDVFKFLLSKFPIPHENTSWEQIIDFRSDQDSQRKYYALVHWVNTVASSNRPISEIEDEFNYLYSQYERHFRIHKMKTNFTTWEMIVAAGIDAITSFQGFKTFAKSLVSLSKERVSLLEQELKLSGSEIAYIHKATQTFNTH